MKTFQRQIKAEYLSASIKLIQSKREREAKQNLTHCGQLRQKECKIMRICWGFMALNVFSISKSPINDCVCLWLQLRARGSCGNTILGYVLQQCV